MFGVPFFEFRGEAKMRFEKCLLVAILVSFGLGLAPFQGTEPETIKYKCIYGTCLNKWVLESGNPDPAWDCANAPPGHVGPCPGYCYFCDGVSSMNLCVVNSTGTGCLPSQSTPQRCGMKLKARCAVVTGGCACDNLSIPPGQEPEECYHYT